MRHGELVSKDVVRHFAAQLRAQGLDPVPLAWRAGILGPAEARAKPLLPAAAVVRFCELGAAAAGDAHLGLHAAARLERGVGGLVEFGVRFAPTLGEAVRFLARHHPLLRGVDAIALAQREGALHLVLDPPRGPAASWPVEEYELAGIVRLLRQAGAPGWAPRSAAFAHPRPPDAGEIQRALGAPRVVFDAPRSGVRIGADDLARPNPLADPALFAFLAAQAERALEALGVELVPARIRARLGELLQGSPPSLRRLARSLRTSPRTLQRRLEESGATYRGLVDAVRGELALRELEEPAATVSALARRLGYASPRAFLRAFRRWTGTTPARWRRRGDVLRLPVEGTGTGPG